MSGIERLFNGDGIIPLIAEIKRAKKCSLLEAKKDSQHIAVMIGAGFYTSDGRFVPRWRKMYLQADGKVCLLRTYKHDEIPVLVENLYS